MYNFLKQLSPNQKVVSVFAFILLVIHFVPYLILGDTAYIRIHDTLEGEWIWLTTLVNQDLALNYDMKAQIPSVMNGIPRFMYPTGLSVNVLLIEMFGSFWGYVFSYLLIRLLAFIGTYHLLKAYILTSQSEYSWRILLSLIFSFIPFFTALGLTVAGQPLIILAFLNLIHSRAKGWEYAYILFFPFYSSIVWAAPFVGLLLVSMAVYHFLKHRITTWKFVIFFSLMNITYLLVNYHMVYSMFISEMPIHRDEYNPFLEWTASITSSLLETAYIFFLGHYHVGMWFTLPVFILACFAFRSSKIRWLLAAILFIALVNGFYLYLVPALQSIHPLLISFVIKRVSVLLPLLWLLVLAYAILSNLQDQAWRRFALFVLINLQVIALFTNDELQHNYRTLLGLQKKPGFEAFTSAALFREIETRIGKEQGTYRVASLGLNPTIAQNNGFYTADGLQSIYPLRQKHAFGAILADELEKDAALSNYFLAWGNRCYLFSAELGFDHLAFMISKEEDQQVNQWDVDVAEMKKLEIKYIFSTVKIKNSAQLGLSLLDTFEHEDSWWKIYVYEIK